MRYRPGARMLIAGIAAAALFAPIGGHAAPLPGAIFTTDSTCTGTNLNLYADKDAVYLDGGPAHQGAAGLPDGSYYIQVTDPSGAVLLGSSLFTGNVTPIVVSGGEFAQCYQVSSIVAQTADGPSGYADTPNNGGEYKVWVSSVGTFDNSSTKTDNFKVRSEAPSPAHLKAIKFYDANANGANDDGQLIAGWTIHIVDNIDYYRDTPVDLLVDPDTYYLTEADALEQNWMHTTSNPATVTIGSGETRTVEFGNLCLGAGGGRTLGFWSNKNGASLFNASDLSMLVSRNLRNTNGTAFDPGNYAAFRNWLLSANATNMANMLSAQMAAMELNVAHGLVSSSALVYAPGANSSNFLGFATIGNLTSEANTELGIHGYTVTAGPDRTYQEALKNALDKANNNLTFVQPTPCAWTLL